MKSTDIEGVYQMTPLQHGMVFHSAMHPDAGFYLEQVTFGLGIALNRDTLERSLNQAAKRHQVLRTGFFWENVKAPVQIVYKKARIPVEEIDWSTEPSARQTQLFYAFLNDDRNKPFDLRRAPLMRATIVKLCKSACQLVLTFHHAILDGWSLNRLFAEIWDIYRALEARQIPNLPPAPSFSEFLNWLGSVDEAKAESYWRKALSDVDGPALLPVLRDPEPGGVGTVDHLVSLLPDGLSDRLVKVARANQVTLNTVMLAAWSLLIGRLSGARQAVFGTIVSGRPPDLSGVEDMIGLFINTVPLKVSLNAARRTSQLLQQVQEETNARRDYEHCSLTDIQSWSNVPNDVPLFETLFIFENIPGATKAGAGQAFAFERTNYPLTILIAPGEAVSVKLLFETARISKDAAGVLLEQFISVLSQLADDPAQPPDSIMPVAQAELISSDDLAPDDPPNLAELWRNRVEATPDAVCIIAGEERFTVLDLEHRVSQYRNGLATMGVRHGEVVVLRGLAGLDLVAGMLAIATFGAAFLLIDESYPEARQRQIFDAAQPRFVIGSVLDGVGLQQIDPAQDGGTPICAALTPEDAVYLVFTSGSTGAPKGVVQIHRSLANRLIWGWQEAPYTRGDLVLQKTPLGFVDAIAEILSPVLGGCTLLMVDSASWRDPQALCEIAAKQRVTHLTAVPGLLTGLIENLDATEQTLPDVRVVHSSGEALSGALARQVEKALPNAAILNIYGSSEVGADAIAHWFDAAHTGEATPIGKPISGTAIRLLDDELNPVPLGAIGEIYVAGAGLARGYLNNPAETARRFLPDPDRPGPRMFRTGDLAWRRHDGALVFAGRTDNQINVHGNRVEPEEIEAICASVNHVAGAAIFAGPDGGLTAAIEPRENGQVDLDTVRAKVAQLLPRGMWPDRIVQVAALPRLPNGKLDRSGLGELVSKTERPNAPMADPPRTETEILLADIWVRLLGRRSVRRSDSFFALGGHSVLAMQLASRVLKRTGIKLPLNLIFERPVLSDLAQAVADRKASASTLGAPIRKSKPKRAKVEERSE